MSWSDGAAATIVRVQASPATKSMVGSIVKVVGPPVTAPRWLPETLQARVNQAPVTFTAR